MRDALVFLFAYTGVAWLYRIGMKRKGPLVRIVVFHDIHDAAWFDSLIETLVNHYHVLTPQAFILKEFKPDAINVLITFDDGYGSWETHALPILEKYNTRGLFFISSGLIDVGESPAHTDTFMRERLMITPRAPLTWNGVERLHASGHTIGSHAQHHLDLTRLSKEEVRQELLEDKARIESMLGTHVTECAYPFGTEQHINPMVVAVAREVGFERGYIAISRFAVNSETFAIPRMCIESSTSPFMLRHWIEGSYDLFSILKKICVR